MLVTLGIATLHTLNLATPHLVCCWLLGCRSAACLLAFSGGWFPGGWAGSGPPPSWKFLSLSGPRSCPEGALIISVRWGTCWVLGEAPAQPTCHSLALLLTAHLGIPENSSWALSRASALPCLVCVGVRNAPRARGSRGYRLPGGRPGSLLTSLLALGVCSASGSVYSSVKWGQ